MSPNYTAIKDIQWAARLEKERDNSHAFQEKDLCRTSESVYYNWRGVVKLHLMKTIGRFSGKTGSCVIQKSLLHTQGWWWWIVFVIWLTSKMPFALFLAETILSIVNLQHAASRIWTSAEPEFRLCWIKLCSSDNHYTRVPLTSIDQQ